MEQTDGRTDGRPRRRAATGRRLVIRMVSGLRAMAAPARSGPEGEGRSGGGPERRSTPGRSAPRTVSAECRGAPRPVAAERRGRARTVSTGGVYRPGGAPYRPGPRSAADPPSTGRVRPVVSRRTPGPRSAAIRPTAVVCPRPVAPTAPARSARSRTAPRPGHAATDLRCATRRRVRAPAALRATRCVRVPPGSHQPGTASSGDPRDDAAAPFRPADPARPGYPPRPGGGRVRAMWRDPAPAPRAGRGTSPTGLAPAPRRPWRLRSRSPRTRSSWPAVGPSRRPSRPDGRAAACWSSRNDGGAGPAGPARHGDAVPSWRSKAARYCPHRLRRPPGHGARRGAAPLGHAGRRHGRPRERGEPPFLLVLDSLETPERGHAPAQRRGVWCAWRCSRSAARRPSALQPSRRRPGPSSTCCWCPWTTWPAAWPICTVRGLGWSAPTSRRPPSGTRTCAGRWPRRGQRGTRYLRAIRRRIDLSVRIPMRGSGSSTLRWPGSVLLFKAAAERPGGAAWEPPSDIQAPGSSRMSRQRSSPRHGRRRRAADTSVEPAAEARLQRRLRTTGARAARKRGLRGGPGVGGRHLADHRPAGRGSLPGEATGDRYGDRSNGRWTGDQEVRRGRYPAFCRRMDSLGSHGHNGPGCSGSDHVADHSRPPINAWLDLRRNPRADQQCR